MISNAAAPMAEAGRLERIWIKRAKRGPMDSVTDAEAVIGKGLAGNANQGGHRQVTVISREAWAAATTELDAPGLDPVLRRANLLVSGLELEGSRGRTLRLGDILILVRGETRPCRAMDEAHPGLEAALATSWRGGVYGQVLAGGRLSIGARAVWHDTPPGSGTGPEPR